MSESSEKHGLNRCMHTSQYKKKKLTQSLHYNCYNVRQATDDKSPLLLIQ